MALILHQHVAARVYLHVRSRIELLRRRLGGSPLARTLFLVAVASALAGTALIMSPIAANEDGARERANWKLHELIEAAVPRIADACFAMDKTRGLEIVQAIVKGDDVLRAVIRCGNEDLAAAERPATGALRQGDASVAATVFSPLYFDEQIGEISVTPDLNAIDRAAANETRQLGFILALFAAMLLVAVGLAVHVVVLVPVKAISAALHSSAVGAGTLLAAPKYHANDVLGRLVGDINDLLGRFKGALQSEHELHPQQILDEKLRLAETVFERSREGIMITDANNRIIQVNPAFTEITGYSLSEVAGQSPRILSSGRHEREFYEGMWNALSETGEWHGEIWDRHKEGKIIPQWLTVNVIRDECGSVANYVAIIVDLTQRKVAEQKIEFLAHYDQLTGLPNRMLVRDRFARAAAIARREGVGIAFLVVDLDHFKQVYGGLGQSVGDRLIIEVAKRLSGCVGDAGSVCRHGADEFIVLLTGIEDLEAVAGHTQRILDAVARPAHFEDHDVSVGASIGIALYPDDGDDFDALLGKAGTAMCAVKTSGRNGYRLFSETMNQDAAEKLRLQAMLGDAIRNDEFRICYQPQINMATGGVDGVEALIRWPHPTMGDIPPGRFIPLAEECGLILQIGDWVLREACRQARQWQLAGHANLIVAVNISAVQFNRGNIVESVRRALEESGLPPELLELELTESALLQDNEGIRRTIEELRSLGVTLSIDDFGTGYSSLAYLKQIKVNKLKIDRSFVRDVGHDPDDLAIVHAIIELGRNLQLRVMAEGIETAEQAEILRRHGCNEGQGYHFSHPLPYDELVRFLRDWRSASGCGSETFQAGR